MNKYFNNYLVLLDQRIKKIFIYLTFLVILVAILELLSISTIIPLILTIFNQELPQLISQFIPNYKIDSTESIIYILAFFVVIFFLKTTFYIFFSYCKHYLSNEVFHHIQKKLVKKYINNNYNFFIDTNKSLLLKNILVEANTVKNFFILTVNLISESIILLSIIILLLFLYLKITIFLCIFVFIFFYLLSLFSKKGLNNLSNKRKNYFSKISILINDIFNNIKTIKILNKYNFFSEKFKDNSKGLVKAYSGIGFIAEYPKSIFEFIFVLIFCYLIYFLSIQALPTQDVIGALTIFAFAGFRIIPSVNKILSSFQNIQGSTASIQLISSELEEKNDLYYKEKIPTNEDQELFKLYKNSIIDIKNINYQVGSNKDNKIIFKNLNLQIKHNMSIGICGKSGSGKTTLVNILMGILYPQSGDIELNGKSIYENIKSWRSNFGFVPQNITILDDSIKSNIAFGLYEDEISKKKIDEVLSQCSLDSLISDLDSGIESQIGENASKISVGQKQRIGIARALYFDAPIIIFDEATNSLDKNTESKILKIIYDISNKTKIIISHDLELLNKCDKIFEIVDKNIKLKK